MTGEPFTIESGVNGTRVRWVSGAAVDVTSYRLRCSIRDLMAAAKSPQGMDPTEYARHQAEVMQPLRNAIGAAHDEALADVIEAGDPATDPAPATHVCDYTRRTPESPIGDCRCGRSRYLGRIPS